MQVDYTRTTTATSEPITVDQMKNYIKENYGTDATEDTLIETMITAARVFIEDETRRAFVKQDVKYYEYDETCPITEIIVPFQPIIEIDSVIRTDIEGDTTALALNTDYFRLGLEGGTENTLKFNRTWSTGVVPGLPITVTFSAGYADNANIPKDVILAIYKLVAENYVNRESSVDWSIESIPYDVATTIEHYKVYEP